MGSNVSFRNRKKGSGLIWFILAIAFVFFMAKWGIPGLINVLAGPTGAKAASVNPADDIVPPQVPSLFPLPEATNSANIFVEGLTEANIEVSLWNNDEQVENTKSDDSGAFKFALSLKEGDNKIQVKVKDGAGNESQTLIKTIVYDKKGVEITIDSPSDGSEVFGKNNQDIKVSGKVSKPDTTITVNGSYARVDATGVFSATVRLNEGENTISISAKDSAGNTAQKDIKVKLTL